MNNHFVLEPTNDLESFRGLLARDFILYPFELELMHDIYNI